MGVDIGVIRYNEARERLLKNVAGLQKLTHYPEALAFDRLIERLRDERQQEMQEIELFLGRNSLAGHRWSNLWNQIDLIGAVPHPPPRADVRIPVGLVTPEQAARWAEEFAQIDRINGCEPGYVSKFLKLCSDNGYALVPA